MWKKSISLLMIGLLLVCLVGCSVNDNSHTDLNNAISKPINKPIKMQMGGNVIDELNNTIDLSVCNVSFSDAYSYTFVDNPSDYTSGRLTIEDLQIYNVNNNDVVLDISVMQGIDNVPLYKEYLRELSDKFSNFEYNTKEVIFDGYDATVYNFFGGSMQLIVVDLETDILVINSVCENKVNQSDVDSIINSIHITKALLV